jgi:hypothetical protein
MLRSSKLPSPAMVVACAALVVSLSGTAVAAGIVANARHANKADLATRALNTDKLQSKTAAQIAAAAATQATSGAAQVPGPASSAAGLITVKTAPWSIAPNGWSDIAVTCDAGQKAIGGGWENPDGWGHPWDSRPTPDGAGWRIYTTVSSDAPSQKSGTVYAICLK